MSLSHAAKSTLRSTSFKLLTVFVLSSMSIIFIVESAAKLITDYSQQKISVRYRTRTKLAQLLALQLEASQDRGAEALRLVRDLDLDLRIEGLHGENPFATSERIATFAEIEKGAVRKIWTPNLRSGEFNQVAFSMVMLEHRRYLFLFHSFPELELQLKWLSPMAALIVLILFANFMLIRWLFRPVSWLSDGIRKLGEGDFDVQVPNRSFDELGDLALSFNRTVERVRAIVESKRQLLLDVSHELRSPLTRIRVALELDGVKAKNHVRSNVLALESMIHELLEAARLESGRAASREWLDLAQVLKTVVASVQGENPGVVVYSEKTPARILANRTHMEICMRNLIDNALKYSKLQSQPVEVSLEGGVDRALQVHIRDFGIGIPENERQLIFEAFYRVDKSRVQETGGYGLGLNLCRKIMLAHGGRVFALAPTSGEGSVFIMEFPLDGTITAPHFQ